MEGFDAPSLTIRDRRRSLLSPLRGLPPAHGRSTPIEAALPLGPVTGPSFSGRGRRRGWWMARTPIGSACEACYTVAGCRNSWRDAVIRGGMP
jgi:hypothetical protein